MLFILNINDFPHYVITYILYRDNFIVVNAHTKLTRKKTFKYFRDVNEVTFYFVFMQWTSIIRP